MPVQQQAGQHFRLAQKRAVRWRRTAHHKVVAAAGAGVAPVFHELFGRQTGLKRGVVQELRVFDKVVPVRHRMNVDLNHTRIGGNLQQLEARVSRGWVAFEHQCDTQLLRRGLNRAQQIKVVLQFFQRRHEDIHHTAGLAHGLGLGAAGAARVAHLDTQCSAGDPGRRLMLGGHTRKVGWLGLHRTLGAGGKLAGIRLTRNLHLAHHCQTDQFKTGRHGITQGQAWPRCTGVLRHQVGKISLTDPGQRVQRQAQTHGRITGHQVHAFIAQKPGTAHPPRTLRTGTVSDLDRKYITHHGIELLLEDTVQTRPLHFVACFGIQRVHIGGQATLAPLVVPHVFISRLDERVADTQLAGQGVRKAPGVFTGVVRGSAFVGKQRPVSPHRLAVSSPVNIECPARQLLAGVPLALAKMQKTTRAILRSQFVHQFSGKPAFGRAECIRIPFWCIAVTHSHKSGLAAHGQAHIARHQFFIHSMAKRHDIGPLRFGIGLGHAGRLVNARHCHMVRELHLTLVHTALNRRGSAGLWCAGQGNMALARQQARRGIQPHPARAGQIHLAPGVQVGEIDIGTTGTVQRLYIRPQLNQVARHKTGRQPAVAQQLHHQPGRITA